MKTASAAAQLLSKHLGLSANNEPAVVRTPANLQPIVNALGVEKAMEFILAFGGGDLYLTAKPRGRSAVAEQFGIERAQALAQQLGEGNMRVPTGKPWLAQMMRVQGMNVDSIARKLHASNVAVRGWLKKAL